MAIESEPKIGIGTKVNRTDELIRLVGENILREMDHELGAPRIISSSASEGLNDDADIRVTTFNSHLQVDRIVGSIAILIAVRDDQVSSKRIVVPLSMLHCMDESSVSSLPAEAPSGAQVGESSL